MRSLLSPVVPVIAVVFFLAGGSLRAQTPVARVQTVSPVEKPLARVTEQPALIEAYAVAPLFPRVSGYVEKVNVEIGQRVKQDEVLLTIAVPDLEAEQKQREAEVLEADAEIEQTRVAIEVARQALATAKCQADEYAALVDRAKSDVDLAQTEYVRNKGLVEQNAISVSILDEATQRLSSMRANLVATKAKQSIGQSRVAESEAQVAAAEANHRAAVAKSAVAKARDERTKTDIQYAKLRAPFPGAIAARHVDPGHLARAVALPGASPLLVVVRDDLLRISVEVPEVEAAMLDDDDNVTLRVPALGNGTISAKVTRVAAAIDPITRTVRAEIELPNADRKLRPGMFAHASIAVDERAKCLVVPASAIMTDDGKTYCLVIKNGAVAKAGVQIGLRGASEVEILSGVSTADHVIPKNLSNYVVGQPAEALPAASKP